MDIIKAILDIEEKAQKIVGTLDEMKGENEKDIAAETERMSEEMRKSAEEKIEKAKQSADDEKKRIMSDTEAEIRSKREKLEKLFGDNRERWVREITEAVEKDDSL